MDFSFANHLRQLLGDCPNSTDTPCRFPSCYILQFPIDDQTHTSKLIVGVNELEIHWDSIHPPELQFQEMLQANFLVVAYYEAFILYLG
jgi:hypothetical protein